MGEETLFLGGGQDEHFLQKSGHFRKRVLFSGKIFLFFRLFFGKVGIIGRYLLYRLNRNFVVRNVIRYRVLMNM